MPEPFATNPSRVEYGGILQTDIHVERICVGNTIRANQPEEFERRITSESLHFSSEFQEEEILPRFAGFAIHERTPESKAQRFLRLTVFLPDLKDELVGRNFLFRVEPC